MAQRYQVLARKYRPQSFRDVVGQEAAVTTLKNAIRFDKVAGGYLFCGSRGVGKTTLARLFAKALNCQSPTADLEPCNQCPSCREITSGQALDVIEIDGASNRGIDDIRQINETVGYAPSHGRYKIYIIDEVHMLTKEAFNALLKTLEEPPEKAKFFFATTEAHKVLPTIISRCQRFDLARIPTSLITSKLQQIAQDLQRSVETEALQLIAEFSEGSLRDAESLFDQILCFAEGTVTAGSVRKSLGLVSKELFQSLDQAFTTCNLSFAFELVDQLFQTGKDLGHFLEQLIEHYRTIVKQTFTTPSAYTQQQALHILDLLIQAEGQFQKSAYQRISLESILLQIIRSKNRIPVEVLVRRLSELEQSMGKEISSTPLEQVEATHPSENPPHPLNPSPITPPAPPSHHQELHFQEKQAEPLHQLPLKTSLDTPAPQSHHQESDFRQNQPDQNIPAEKIITETLLMKGLPAEEISSQLEPATPHLLPNPELVPKPSHESEDLPAALPTSKEETKPLSGAPQAPFSLKPLPFTPESSNPVQQEIVKEKQQEATNPSAHPPYHYDTLMRFAAIELEGTIKLG